MANVISNYGHLLLAAMGRTIILALWGLFFACILGLIFGILSVMKNKLCKAVAFVFVYIIRGIPMIVLAYFIFFGVPQLLKEFGTPITFTALQAGTIALALN